MCSNMHEYLTTYVGNEIGMWLACDDEVGKFNSEFFCVLLFITTFTFKPEP